jgi:hypothetical protein
MSWRGDYCQYCPYVHSECQDARESGDCPLYYIEEDEF